MAIQKVSSHAIADGVVTPDDLHATLDLSSKTVTLPALNQDVEINGNVDLGDDDRLRFGASDDLQIYHTSTQGSWINNTGSGNLKIQSAGVYIRNASGNAMITADTAERVNLWYQGSSGAGLKLQTTSTGINVTGAITVNGSALEAGAKQGVFWENDQSLTTSYTISTSKNALSAGPVTLNSGVTVTIPSGSRWVVV